MHSMHPSHVANLTVNLLPRLQLRHIPPKVPAQRTNRCISLYPLNIGTPGFRGISGASYPSGPGGQTGLLSSARYLT